MTRRSMQVKRYDPREDLGFLLRDSGNIDLALILLHGRYGEDGSMQGLLDLLGIPYVGSGILGSAMAMNKRIAKSIFRTAGLLVADDVLLCRGEAFSAESDPGSPRCFHGGETGLGRIEHRSHDLPLQGRVGQRNRRGVSP